MDERSWILLVHDEQATPLDLLCSDCGATLTTVPIAGITTLGDEDIPWSGTCRQCPSCGDLTAPRVSVHRKPPHQRRKPRR